MLTLALCNIFGSFFQSMPTCGAFTRSAVISASGVRTPFACLYSAGITLVALAFLGPYFHLIPRATLAAVLIAAIIYLIDWEIVRPLYKSHRMDFITLVFTLVGCLCLGIEIGMVIGIIISLMYLVYKWARPDITVETTKCCNGVYATVIPQSNLYFPSVDYFSSIVIKNSLMEDSSQMPVLIDCSKVNATDYSAAKNIILLSKMFETRGQQLLLANVPDNTSKVWKSAGCSEMQFCESNHAEHSLFGIHLEQFQNSETQNKSKEDHCEEEVQQLMDKEKPQ